MFSLSVTAMAGMCAERDDFVLDPDFSPQRRLCCSLARVTDSQIQMSNDAASLACCSECTSEGFCSICSARPDGVVSFSGQCWMGSSFSRQLWILTHFPRLRPNESQHGRTWSWSPCSLSCNLHGMISTLCQSRNGSCPASLARTRKGFSA